MLKPIDRGGKIKLASMPTSTDGGMERDAAEAKTAPLLAELNELQELLFAAGTHGLLVVLQGRDTAGKDGALETIGGAMNPGGCRVASFKVPTPTELAHDFLWRVHREAPGRGEVVFFNRSHYEDVLVVRVHKLAPEKVWKKRFEHINAFEALLSDSNVLIVKFLLNISKSEQEERLKAREADPTKAWKLNPGDWEERKLWDDYTAAYDDILERCSTPNAPWFVVPADHKWYRNLVMAQTLVETLRPLRKNWEKTLAERSTAMKKALDEQRAAVNEAASLERPANSAKNGSKGTKSSKENDRSRSSKR